MNRIPPTPVAGARPVTDGQVARAPRGVMAERDRAGAR